jgi:hypothetical protein
MRVLSDVQWNVLWSSPDHQGCPQILRGVAEAQTSEHGTNIAAAGPLGRISDRLMLESDGAFTVVDFDVSVVAETKTGGKGGIKVWGSKPAAGWITRSRTAARFGSPFT